MIWWHRVDDATSHAADNVIRPFQSVAIARLYPVVRTRHSLAREVLPIADLCFTLACYFFYLGAVSSQNPRMDGSGYVTNNCGMVLLWYPVIWFLAAPLFYFLGENAQNRVTFAWRRHCCWWVLSFVGDQHSVLFYLFAIGCVTAMPRGIHVKLCHAFLHRGP